jgi:hypothetical protein
MQDTANISKDVAAAGFKSVGGPAKKKDDFDDIRRIGDTNFNEDMDSLDS